ncbi:hypothetical protein HUJ04_001648 [Dendroctonus ponderosae]|nr:hypothetical protein HUJ04_001648 [Dendroctonus ponderosae]
MSEPNGRQSVNDPLERIIGEMASDIRNEGQYIPLGFSAQQSVSDPINWNPQPNANAYLNYGLSYPEPHLSPACQEPLANYINQNGSMFEPVVFQKNLNMPEFNGYDLRSNSAPQTLYNSYPQSVIADNILHDSLNQNAPIFDNLVGNWSMPNNTATYSPFGNTDTFKPSLFDFQAQNGDNSIEEDLKFKQHEFVNDKFNFNKDLRKSRPLAEVKPMRPSYSDVLTKPVPANNAKTFNIECKDVKFKKDARKNGKIDKPGKSSNLLNRSNTNNDIKDLPGDKTLIINKPEKKNVKPNQLTRKWASLDNIAEPAAKAEEPKRIRKQEESYTNKPVNKTKIKSTKTINNPADEVFDDAVKAESVNITKNLLKKNKPTARQKQNEGHSSGSERPSSKRPLRSRKKESQLILCVLKDKIKLYTKGWWKVFTVFALWLIHLISDVCSLSVHLGRDFIISSWTQLIAFWTSFTSTSETILKRCRLTAWIWEKVETKFKKNHKKPRLEEETNNLLNNGIDNNISMPTTGDEAMKRLLACKGKDPYSILGVTPKCTDDDIKKYYKRQAFLVHPDKNNQPGAEEAFKILVHAFDMIGAPERRATYDRGVAESAFVVQNFSQMAELLQKLQQKMEMNANTIRCSACGDRHKRIRVDRPSYAARN